MSNSRLVLLVLLGGFLASQLSVAQEKKELEHWIGMLLRYHGGEARVWSVVRLPTPADEDRRRRDRAPITASVCHDHPLTSRKQPS